MELSRENRRLEMGPEWGTRLAKRMMATERRYPRQTESDKVRHVLSCYCFCVFEYSTSAVSTTDWLLMVDIQLCKLRRTSAVHVVFVHSSRTILIYSPGWYVDDSTAGMSRRLPVYAVPWPQNYVAPMNDEAATVCIGGSYETVRFY